MKNDFHKDAFLEQNMWRVKRGALPLEWSIRLRLLAILRCKIVNRKNKFDKIPRWYRILKQIFGGKDIVDNVVYSTTNFDVKPVILTMSSVPEYERNMRDMDYKIGSCASKFNKKLNRRIWIFNYTSE